MIVELANTISSQDGEYQKFDIPKDTFSRARYKNENDQSLQKVQELGIDGRLP
jgi:hypothetical protein